MSDTRASHDGSLLCDMAVLPAVIVCIYTYIIMLSYGANRRRLAVVHGDFTGQ